jgi:hypothetical protein
MAYLRRSMPRARPTRSLLVLASVLAVAACERRGDRDARARAFSAKETRAPAAFDFSRPLEALRMSADEAAASEGSFAWEGRIEWTVSKPGAAPVRAVEQHRLRQLATGEFHAEAEIDPGADAAGPDAGSATGREVIYTGGMTYARTRWAPFRERPSDRGEGARRFRDESFRAAASLLDLLGPALEASAAGETVVLGRPARRFALTLGGAAPKRSAPPPEGLPDGGYDPDTRRHLAFLEGSVPAAAAGELVLDARTGVPLAVELRASFTERDDPQLRADVALTARWTALAGAVAAVRVPDGALPDERKPKGVARALEAAGLRKRGAPASERGQPDEESEDEPPEEAPAGRGGGEP